MTDIESVKISLHEKYGFLSSDDIDILLKSFFDSIAFALSDKRRVELRGFGSFELREYGVRNIYNIKNHSITECQTSLSLCFRSGGKLKEIVNS